MMEMGQVLQRFRGSGFTWKCKHGYARLDQGNVGFGAWASASQDAYKTIALAIILMSCRARGFRTINKG